MRAKSRKTQKNETPLEKIKKILFRTSFLNLFILQDCFIAEDQESYQKIITVWKDWQLSTTWQFILEIQFNHELWILTFSGYFLYNGLPVTINPHYSRLSAIYIFQSLNQAIMSFYNKTQFDFNPETGTILLVSKVLLNPLDIENKKTNLYCNSYIQENIGELLQHSIKLQNVLLYFNGHLEMFPNIYNKQQNLQSNKTYPINTLSCILEMLPEIVKPQIEELENFNSKKEMISFFLENYQQFSLDTSRIINQLRPQSAHPLQKQFFNELSDMIEHLYSSSCSQVEVPIVQEIEILSEISDRVLVGKGGFGAIYKFKVSYRITTQQDPKYNQVQEQWLCLKKNLPTAKNKNFDQLHIIQKFRNQYHPNIVNYFCTQQKQYQGEVITKYQANLSMEDYLKRNSTTACLGTVFWLLEEVMRGLIFLKQKDIVHMDLKPSNIVVGENLQIQIIDFGESIFIPEYSNIRSSAFTIPYSANQRFRLNKKSDIDSKIDIFSMGNIIFKCVFRKHIWGHLCDNLNFKQSFKQGVIPRVLSPQICQKFGFALVLQKIVKLSLDSVSSNRSDRPSLDYMFIMLYLCRKYIEQTHGSPFKFCNQP